jgi:hypothetical protein
MDPESIIKIVNFIQSSDVPNKEEFFAAKYKNFKKNYPVLFDVACRPEPIDQNMLNMMIQMVSKIHNKELTQHDASVNVGQVLFDKYVDPIVK